VSRRSSRAQYATYFDQHYLTRGLALYLSLVRHSPPFTLRVLCLDDQTERVLSALQLDRLELVRLADLERTDPALLAAKPTRDRLEYYFTTGPAFLVYLLDQHPNIDTLTYLDADLFFFSDPTPIYDELGDDSILITDHRYSPSMHALYAYRGVYNVGLLVFRRTASGQACLRRWREQCIEWCYFREESGRWADQKYLEAWPLEYDGVTVLQHRGAALGPWNLGNVEVRYQDGKLLVDGEPAISYHFNRFRVVTGWLYDPGLWRYRLRMPPTAKQHLYIPYARELRAAGRLVRAVGGTVPSVDHLLYGRSKLVSIARMARYRSSLFVTDTVAF
jgi:hypothetical protein